MQWHIAHSAANLVRVLGTNSLVGSIPASWSGLTNLQEMMLHDNQLSGTLPSFVSNLLQLQELYLPIYLLSSVWPLNCFRDLRTNLMSGTLPMFPGLVTGLYLLNNKFSGDVSNIVQMLNASSIVALYVDTVDRYIDRQIDR